MKKQNGASKRFRTLRIPIPPRLKPAGATIVGEPGEFEQMFRIDPEEISFWQCGPKTPIEARNSYLVKLPRVCDLDADIIPLLAAHELARKDLLKFWEVWSKLAVLAGWRLARSTASKPQDGDYFAMLCPAQTVSGMIRALWIASNQCDLNRNTFLARSLNDAIANLPPMSVQDTEVVVRRYRACA